MTRYVNTSTAAKILGYSVDYFRRAIAPHIPRYKLGRGYFFRMTDITDFVEKFRLDSL